MSNSIALFLCKVQLSVSIIHEHSKYYLNYVKLHLYGIPATENGLIYVLIGKLARLISQIDFAISSFRHQTSSCTAAYTFLIKSLDQPIALTGFQIGKNALVFVIKVFNLLLSARGKNCALSFVTALEYSPLQPPPPLEDPGRMHISYNSPCSYNCYVPFAMCAAFY